MIREKATLQELADRFQVYTALDEPMGPFGYDEEPHIGNTVWMPAAGSKIILGTVFDVDFDGDWKDSLHSPRRHYAEDGLVMTKRQSKTLEASIKHWERIEAGEEAEHGTDDCALCIKYARHGCKFCPVAISTGEAYCIATPYPAWSVHQTVRHLGYEHGVYCPECVTLAHAEVEFLRSLRDE